MADALGGARRRCCELGRAWVGASSDVRVGFLQALNVRCQLPVQGKKSKSIKSSLYMYTYIYITCRCRAASRSLRVLAISSAISARSFACPIDMAGGIPARGAHQCATVVGSRSSCAQPTSRRVFFARSLPVFPCLVCLFHSHLAFRGQPFPTWHEWGAFAVASSRVMPSAYPLGRLPVPAVETVAVRRCGAPKGQRPGQLRNHIWHGNGARWQTAQQTAQHHHDLGSQPLCCPHQDARIVQNPPKTLAG